jgi:hypothetical protein
MTMENHALTFYIVDATVLRPITATVFLVYAIRGQEVAWQPRCQAGATWLSWLGILEVVSQVLHFLFYNIKV